MFESNMQQVLPLAFFTVTEQLFDTWLKGDSLCLICLAIKDAESIIIVVISDKESIWIIIGPVLALSVLAITVIALIVWKKRCKKNNPTIEEVIAL